MLEHDTRQHPAHVEFIGYTGKWPSLCHGVLTLKIDGRKHTFGTKGRYGDRLPDGSEPEFETFWRSGGHCNMPPDGIEYGDWILDVGMIPEQFRQYAEEIDAVMNANMEHGCCGGCR